MSIIETLTEGMVHRNMQQEGASLLNKWSQTGLLEGLSNDEQKAGMARLLENQARELLRESNTMAGGDVEGFAAVAFPIVRRVFAGLIANDLVSVQPMSLPSGLIFFMDFTFGSSIGDVDSNGRLGTEKDRSIYGQGVVGAEITGGVNLNSNTMDQQPYGLGAAYSSPTGSIDHAVTVVLDADAAAATLDNRAASINEALFQELDFDTDLLSEHAGDPTVAVGKILSLTITKTNMEATGFKMNMEQLSQIHAPIHEFTDATTTKDNWDSAAGTLTGGHIFKQLRRLTSYDLATDTVTFYYVVPASLQGVHANKANGAITAASLMIAGDITTGAGASEWEGTQVHASYPSADTIDASATGGIGAIAGGDFWGLEGNPEIPEIDIKVDSIAITAVTKKLKAKWTPELGQDLNAYHNLDAEVELTSILSEQIALEIDREILQDLIKGATAGTFYWSRSPGLFLNRVTGVALDNSSVAPDFTGTVSEWYETLIETINDVSAQIHRKTLRGGANFVVLSPEVANVLEFTAGFRANVTADADKGDIGAVKVGSLNRKFDVIVDPYFPRNAILVGRKGSSFLESGYVYAPYVPLQTTPTIFGPDDFVPRKGVMTRYGKKMVRPDMYGLVIVRGLLGDDVAQ